MHGREGSRARNIAEVEASDRNCNGISSLELVRPHWSFDLDSSQLDVIRLAVSGDEYAYASQNVYVPTCESPAGGSERNL